MAWSWPVADPHVTSHWDMTRVHPVTRVVTPHYGTDYRAPTGTPVRAINAGTAVMSEVNSAAGQRVRVDHGGGAWSGYHHLSRRDVAIGQKVSAGQVIGLAGNTGLSTAAHLHLEISVDGAKTNPHVWLAAQIAAQAATPTPLTPATQEDDMIPLIQTLYPYYLGRTGGPAEILHWSDTAARNGWSPLQLHQRFVDSPAERGTVDRAYVLFLGRKPGVETDYAARVKVRTIADVFTEVSSHPESTKRGNKAWTRP